jgi:hypothetical protein
VARRETRRADDLRQELLTAGITVQHTVLAALLEVEDELHGHAGVAGPARVRRSAAVAAQVAGIGGHLGPSSALQRR